MLTKQVLAALHATHNVFISMPALAETTSQKASQQALRCFSSNGTSTSAPLKPQLTHSAISEAADAIRKRTRFYKTVNVHQVGEGERVIVRVSDASTCVRVCARAHTHIHTHTHTHTCTHTHMHTYTHAYAHAHARTHARMHASTCVSKRAHTHTHTQHRHSTHTRTHKHSTAQTQHTHTHARTHTHTHTNTDTNTH